jgi:hypothetical protein
MEAYLTNWGCEEYEKPSRQSKPKGAAAATFESPSSHPYKGAHIENSDLLKRVRHYFSKSRFTCDTGEVWVEVQQKLTNQASKECAVKKSESDSALEKSDALAKEFHSLVTRWKDETFAISSLSKIYMHPSYQRIIAMGEAGLPLVLNALREDQGNWFYALKYMAGEDVSEGIKNFEDAKAAWLEWGYAHNYI